MHWLTVRSRISSKILLLTSKSLCDLVPQCLSYLLLPCTPAWILLSTDKDTDTLHPSIPNSNLSRTEPFMPPSPTLWDVTCSHRLLGFDFWPESDLLGFLERPLTYRLTMAAIINVNLWQCTTALMLMSHYSISCGTTLLFATRAPASLALLPSGADSSPLGAQFRENMAAVPALDYPEGNLG